MRTVYALMVLVVVTGGVMTGGVMTAQARSDAAPGGQRNPALPPAPPPPLYAPDRDLDRPRPLSEEEVERLLLAMRRNVAQPGGGQAEPTDEFTSISELPPEDKLPAAPMLVAAYAFVMLAIFAYLVSLSRRLNAVARDLAKFESQSRRP